MYASKFGVDESKVMERLWGENFFDPATKKWTAKNTGSPTCKRGTWLPASTALLELLEMMIHHLPSPLKGRGPLDDKYAESIRNCDPEGPLILYVSKMILHLTRKGRVFAGK
ncbi:hypothetical protein IFM89_039846, partial [Coptis chinensis]